ncbi:hypothetical protein Tco_0493671 [Tanacetum coccineum]
MLTKPQVFYDNIHKQALGYQNPFYLKKAQRIKPTLYDGIVISVKHVAMPVIDNEETLILEEESRSKMFEKEKDPEAIKQNISHKPIDYEKVNRLSDDFGKRFTPQQELSAEQAFWLRKQIIENVVHLPSATTISPGMFKLDLVPLPPRLLQNREVYLNYLRHTQEQADTLREIVEQAKAIQPLDRELDLACKHTTRIQELFVYVQDTCPNAITPSTKKVAVTPMNNVKKVRFAEPLTSLSNIKQVESSNTSDSNTPVLSSTGVKCSTSNCGSKPLGNKKNDIISQTPSRNKKNKVEAQPRKVNKKNHVVKPGCDVDVMKSLSNANSEIQCATCNKSMFDDVHDKCLIDLVQNGNNRTKSAKKHKKQNVWKPTGHVFTVNEVDLKWRNNRRIFTIVGMTRLLRIMGYVSISWKCFAYLKGILVEGLGTYNCFLLAYFVDADLEVAFRKNTWFYSQFEGVDLFQVP